MRTWQGWVWAAIYFIFVASFVYSAWASWLPPLELDSATAHRIAKVEERDLGLAAASGAVGVGITAGSIVLAVIGAIVGLGHNLTNQARDQFLLAAGYCGLSLVAGAFTVAALPQLAWRENVVFSKFPSVLIALQIYALVPAFIGMFLGTYSVLRGGQGANRSSVP